ncbi:hypothetical protein D7Y44_11715 [Stenotrophomonas maltophilia]|nr:hypothetical protein [Stenotrophomonas maltophilia]MBA0345534.1 hypothetical protein [Stenotrophomonas maltophilia]MBA0358102.1 hypothetical protein [Stenotrophomonas maltophilia]MBA0519719.1 hypothetical protein [Stenotrophomonas maltophilia]
MRPLLQRNMMLLHGLVKYRMNPEPNAGLAKRPQVKEADTGLTEAPFSRTAMALNNESARR